MEIDYSIHRIKLKHTFGISRSKNEWYDILFIYIIDGAIIGRGEVAPSARYNETIQKIIPIIKNSIRLPNDLNDRKTIWEFIRPQLMGIKALEAGFSMALWDWWGHKIGRPVFELLSLNSKKISIAPISAFRPRRWAGKIVSDKSKIVIMNLSPKKRPISAVADNVEVRNAKKITIKVQKKIKFHLLYDKSGSLQKKIKIEQIRKEIS